MFPVSCSVDSWETYFIRQCHRHDPDVNQCLKDAANHLAMNFRRGIPELGYPEVEPIVIDEISIALGSGPDGYRATFMDIEAYGVSNLTVVGVRSDLNSYQFQLSFYIPKISARAHYQSSGVLLVMQASEGVKAKIYFRATPQMYKGRKYLVTEEIKMDFGVKDINMGIENLHSGNTVIRKIVCSGGNIGGITHEAALNLFINSNAQELLKEMKPDIKKNIIRIMKRFLDNLFTKIPYDMWMLDS
uniref:Uncharacterized protein n=1 Tax=Timema tahoe TaxID=61484 RepID=A0A7R9FNS8_9NEOP|nr:unnamed protein product [Timema tahoe]